MTEPPVYMALLPGHGYLCSCGLKTGDIDQLREHLLSDGRGHKSKGKINLKTGKSTNNYYLKKGKGGAKVSAMKKFGVYPDSDDESTVTEDPEQDTQICINDTQLQDITPIQDTPPVKDTPPKTEKKPVKKDKEPLPSRTTDNLAEATQLRFVPKVYQCTLTPTLMMTLEICYNDLGWPKTMKIEDVLDLICRTFMKEHGIELFYYRMDPAVVEALRQQKSSNNGAEEQEEVPAL